MYLYIDKDNLISIIKQKKHPLHDDVVKTMKKQLSLFFNFSKKSIEGDELIMPLFMLLTDGAGDAANFSFLDENTFPRRPIDKSCLDTFSENKFSAIFLINDPALNLLKDTGAVLVGGVGEEMDIFDKIYLKNKDDNLYVKLKNQIILRWCG